MCHIITITCQVQVTEGERRERLAGITLLFSSALLSDIYHCHFESMPNEVLRGFGIRLLIVCAFLNTVSEQTSTPSRFIPILFSYAFQTMQQRLIPRKCGGSLERFIDNEYDGI
jgi:hypothetical protein